MKTAAAFLLLCGAASCTPTQFGSWLLARKLGAQSGEYGVSIERAVALTSTDGITLVADVYHPQQAGRTPTILVRLPYSQSLSNKFFATVVGRFWAERGYTAVIQGTRGRYQSGGTYSPFRHERQDGIDTLRWIARQPWFDGRIGMWGGSYFGYTQWVIADQENPGPSALMIQISSTSFYDMFYPGGAFSLESALMWAVQSAGPDDEWPTQEILEAGYRGFPLVQADDRAFKDISFFNDWALHSERDDYWRAVDGEDRAQRLAAPVLLMAGWYDPFLPSQIRDFVSIRRNGRPEAASASRLIIGPWAHAHSVTSPGMNPKNYRLESLEHSVPWFDEHLRSGRTVFDAPIRIYVMGENVWRNEEQWPLERTRYTPFYLHSDGRANGGAGDGTLLRGVTAPEEHADKFVYDPRDPVPTAGGAMIGPRGGIASQNEIEKRSDVLIYSTPALDQDVEATGPVKAVLFVSTSAPHTDFTAKLIDVHPDGSTYNISEGILRRKYEPSNRPVPIEIDLWPTSMLFRRGHRIRLEISSSNYPRFDRNPNTGREIATETNPITASQIIYHGPENLSRLILPLIPRSAASRATK